MGMNAEEKLFVKKVFRNIKIVASRVLLSLIRLIKKIKIGIKVDVLIYSHFDTMDSHVMAFYNAIKDQKLNIKLIFWWR